MNNLEINSSIIEKDMSFFSRAKRDLRVHRSVYIMLLPVLAYYIIFAYVPMYGAIIAFQDYAPIKGIVGSSWVGFRHFIDFFESPYFIRVLRNTLVISISVMLVSFPASIILALMMNELRQIWFKKITQTISYIPHFISMVVVAGMIKSFTSDTGFINIFLTNLGLISGESMLTVPEYFLPIYVISDVWQNVGWDTIIYLAALAAVNNELYEAARIDGAGKLRQLFAITLPSIAPTIVMLLVLRIGSLMSLGYEKIILLYNELTYETSDVISSFVYRKGLLEADYSFSTAVGLFNYVINFILVVTANGVSRKLNGSSIW